MRLTKILYDIKSKYINESLEKIKVYHGSNKKFNKFDDSLLSTGEGSDLFGKGYYFTDNQDVANFYAHLRSKQDKVKGYKNLGPLKTFVPIYQDNADDYAEKTKIVNSFVIKGNILNVEDYIIDDKFKKYIIDSYKTHTNFEQEIAENIFRFLRNNKNEIKNFRGELLYIINMIGLGNVNIINDIVSYIKKMGYDGLKYRPDKNYEGNSNSWNYVIYNKNVIKTK